jgi:hypothetical protein
VQSSSLSHCAQRPLNVPAAAHTGIPPVQSAARQPRQAAVALSQMGVLELGSQPLLLEAAGSQAAQAPVARHCARPAPKAVLHSVSPDALAPLQPVHCMPARLQSGVVGDVHIVLPVHEQKPLA